MLSESLAKFVKLEISVLKTKNDIVDKLGEFTCTQLRLTGSPKKQNDFNYLELLAALVVIVTVVDFSFMEITNTVPTSTSSELTSQSASPARIPLVTNFSFVYQ